jgi:hypothetical protein
MKKICVPESSCSEYGGRIKGSPDVNVGKVYFFKLVTLRKKLECLSLASIFFLSS